MKFFLEPNQDFRLLGILVYIIVDGAIAKNSKFTFFIVHQLPCLFEALNLLKLTHLVFQIFLSDFLLIYPFAKDHRHSFSFGILEPFLEDFVLGEVRVLDDLAKSLALDCDVRV